MLWILFALLLAALFLFGGSAFLLYIALKEVRRHDDAEFANTLRGEMAPYREVILRAIQEHGDLTTESFEIRSFDGLRLYAELYPAQGEPRGSILLAHGYRGGSRSEFSCVLDMYHEQGLDILLIDERAQGRSEGKRMGLGVLERHDIARWAQFLAQRHPNKPIILSGVSMGATSVMMAAGLSLPKEVAGIIADCGFTSPDAIVAWLVRRLHLPVKLMMPILRLVAHPVLGYGLQDTSTIDALAQSNLPLLLVHGEADRFVPCDMSRENFAASSAKDKELVTVPRATHGMSFLVDKERCVGILLNYLARILPR